jgi:hypothetical protein
MRFVPTLAAAGILAATTDALATNGGRWIYRDARGIEVAPSTYRSTARIWNEALLNSIRRDLARPTVHARNLYHHSIAMWDAWAAYDPAARQLIHRERAAAADVSAARREAISYASFRLIRHRFATSPGAAQTLAACDSLMMQLGYDPAFTSTDGPSPAALGNRVAASVIAYGLADGSNEANRYANNFYMPVNGPLVPALPISMGVNDPNRWQPLSISFYIDQNGNPVAGGSLSFLSPEWGYVTPFAMTADDLTTFSRDGHQYPVYHDPGAPPLLGTPTGNEYKRGFEMVLAWGKHLDATDPVTWDISPGAFGNAGLPDAADANTYYNFEAGGGWGTGRSVNPVTGRPYAPHVVRRGDFTRVLAEYWADGPRSETPPGHWFTIMNYVQDHPLFSRRWGGQGPDIDPLEWDVKAYLTLGGALHDAAVSAWGVKGWYDYIRPISALRYIASLGQSSDPALPSYHPDGIRLYPGLVELITTETTRFGERHFDLRGFEGEIAFNTWRGPDYIFNPDTDVAGVGWILGQSWWPYQLPSFVTPPFAGYVSGHSTFSRAGAEVLTLLTGSEYFPGGIGEYECPRDTFLASERGPSTRVVLQWATFFDASEQSSFSRIWGGIHPPQDDLPGRQIGSVVGRDAFAYASALFAPPSACPADFNGDGFADFFDFNDFVACFEGEPCPPGKTGDFNNDGFADFFDFDEFVVAFESEC